MRKIEEYKQVNIYVDKKKNLIVVAVGIIDKWGGMITEIDVVETLNTPYHAEEVEKLLTQMMGKWRSLIPIENDISPLEKHLGVKGYSKAIKGKKLVEFSWNKNEGYIVTPTHREKQGFVSQDNNKVLLGDQIKIGELHDALVRAIEVSTSL